MSETTHCSKTDEPCPESGETQRGEPETHIPVGRYIPATGGVVRYCDRCRSFMGEWSSLEEYQDEGTDEYIEEVSACGLCGELAEYGAYTNTAMLDGDVYHLDCLLREHGWEHVGWEEAEEREDVPYSSNSNRPCNYHKPQSIDLCGERFEWDEWLCVDAVAGDHIRDNLPTRDDLTTEQLETLRDGLQEAREVDRREPDRSIPGLWIDDLDGSGFPAAFVLRGGLVTDMYEKWVCPDCGEIVEPKEGRLDVDLSAECDNCGSDRWLTAGSPLMDSEDAFAPLSDRERQVVRAKMVADPTDKELAEALDVEPSTVRQYLERARSKARRGKKLYDKMDTWDVL